MRISFPLASLVLLLLPSCRSPKPANLSSWNACSLSGHVLAPGGENKPSQMLPGEGRLLFARAEWGRSPFVSEYTFGELVLVVPPTLRTGTVLENPVGEYKEGSQALGFRSVTLRGSVVVLEDGPSTVKLKVDLSAEAPTVDLFGRKSTPLKGEVEALKRSRVRDCPM